MIQSVGEYSHGENSICIHFLPGIPLELLGVTIANTGSELWGLCACRNYPHLLSWKEIYWSVFCLIVHPALLLSLPIGGFRAALETL